jgi:hypothetical protein
VAKADSDLLIGKPIALTGPFDSTGITLETTLEGDRISTAAYDVDSKFLPVRKMPAVASGYEEAALDQFQRVYGSGGVTLPWAPRGHVHAYYPLRGYSQGYTVDGNNVPYFQATWGEGVSYGGSDQAYYWGKHAAPSNSYIRLAQGVYSANARVIHNPIHNNTTNVNYQHMRVRVPAGSGIRSRINFAWIGVETSIDVDIQGTTGTAGNITISGAYRQVNAGTATTITPVVSALTGLSTANELAMVMQWGFLTTAVNATLRVKVYAYDPASPPGGAPTVVAQVDLTNAMRTYLSSQNSTITRLVSPSASGFRDVIMSQTDSTWPVHYPVITEPNLLTVNIDTTADRNLTTALALSMRESVIPAWEGSGWDYLKMLCSARGLQMRVVSGKLAVTNLFPIGTVQPVGDVVGTPRLTIQGAGRARSIDVNQYSSVPRRSFAVSYVPVPALEIGISHKLELFEESRTTIQLPPGEYQLGEIRPTVITDRDGRAQTWKEVWNGGGRIKATVDMDGVVSLVFRSPTREGVNWAGGAYTGYGPWTIHTLMVGNLGYFEAPRTVTLYTGAPPEMTTREKGGDVSNPFLCTPADVFNVSTWLISNEGSPRVELTFSVPGADRDRYGVGQIVSYGWGQFRVMNVSHGRGSTTVSCAWFATQAQQSANWSGQTANQWNTYWSGKRAYDVFLRPLASPVPVKNPEPFIRVYPSETRNAS